MSLIHLLAVVLLVGAATVGTGLGAVDIPPGSDAPLAPQGTPPPASTGGPIGTRFLILNDASVPEQSAAVAYSPARDEYLVVWYTDQTGNYNIRARRVAGDGTPVGPAFDVSAGSGAERRYPDVAYNLQRNEYLVVWEHYESSSGYAVHGQVVSATGVVRETSDLVFATNPSTAIGYLQPAVAYASASDKYLLVYRYDNGAMFWSTLVAKEIDSDVFSWGTGFGIVDWSTPDLP